MGFIKKWDAFWNPTIALAFDRESLWSAGDPNEAPRRSAACIALDAKTRKVVAVGDKAERMQAEAGPGLKIVNYSRYGSIVDYDVAEVAFRQELRSHLKSKWRIAPRVLVATSLGDVEKRVVKDAVINAGARDLITIPRLMAAAIGAGLDVAKSRAETIVYADRDWCGFAVIGHSEMLAAWEGRDAFDQVLAEQAWLDRKIGDEEPMDLTAMFRRLVRQGVANDPSCTAFIRRLHEHYRVALATLSPADAAIAKRGTVHLLGPCANIPGLKTLLASTWARPVVAPPCADAAVILGCRSLLGEISGLMKSFKR